MSGPGTRSMCAACEFEIVATPFRYLGLAYCCEGCAGGGPCVCTYADRPGNPDAVDGLGLPFATGYEAARIPANTAVEPSARERLLVAAR
jgi:hypothetical protein